MPHCLLCCLTISPKLPDLLASNFLFLRIGEHFVRRHSSPEAQHVKAKSVLLWPTMSGTDSLKLQHQWSPRSWVAVQKPCSSLSEPVWLWVSWQRVCSGSGLGHCLGVRGSRSKTKGRAIKFSLHHPGFLEDVNEVP